jgi:hypothetical protein
MNFTSETNKKLLWEVLVDELGLNNISQQSTISNIKIVFEKNLQMFKTRINPNDSLVHLNKQFLKIMIMAVNKLFPNLKQDLEIKRLTITSETPEEPLKAEDLHQYKQTQLTNLYNKQKQDFEQYNILSKPPEINLTDNIIDEKITEMDSLLAEKIAQRNADLNSNYSIMPYVIDESKYTNKTSDISISSNNKLKYLNLDDPNNISLNTKKVTWEDTSSETFVVTSIFDKLKKVNDNKTYESNLNENKNESSLNNKTYETQDSMPLPSVEQQVVSTINSTLSNIITPSVSGFLPTSEIVKQLNEINSKLDLVLRFIEKQNA